MRQLAIGWPSRWTVHAPQSPVPQPSFGPVRPSVSRNVSSSVSYGCTRTSTASPLTVHWRICFATSVLPGPREGGGERATSQDANEVTAVLGGAALVADRARGLDGELRRALDQRRRERLTGERLLGCRRAHGGRRHRRERDACGGAHAVRERELRRDADDGDVELAARRVAEILAAAVGL